MKTSMTKVSVALAMMALSGAAVAGIAQTKHNLGAAPNGAGPNSGGWNWTDATTEICVFCHTPHGADNAAAAPLWNRALGASASYTTYASLGTTTMDATSTNVGSVSLACLSCHDGTQGMDSVINSQGGGTAGTVGVGSFVGAGGPNLAGFMEFSTMGEVTAEMIYLGTDLSNDHPIGMQYAGALVVGVGGTARTALDLDFNPATSATVGGTNVVWYVDTGTAGKQKTDLPLYNRSDADSVALLGEPLVECATCHDPHVKNTTFLRNVQGNNNSATCLSCHVK